MSQSGHGALEMAVPIVEDHAHRAATDPMAASKPPVVLIVEDSRAFREVLSDFLKLCIPKVVVHVAPTGGMALLELARSKPQLVLMDINLPDINGVEVTRLFKERSPNTLVIAMSIMTDKSIADKARANGAAFISKDHMFRDLQPLLVTIFGSSENPLNYGPVSRLL